MPAPNHLNSEQKEKLQKALKEEENAYKSLIGVFMEMPII